MPYSANPYRGCEHGCVYCYARNSHTYQGFSAGLDFEQNIVAKPNAPELLEALFRKKSWQPAVISLSGNTDCYQPTERKLGITRRMLEVFLKFRNPVGIITKNALVLRDLDILQELAKLNLVSVNLSITTLDEGLRRKMEPRTASAKMRLQTVKRLHEAGVPVGIMNAPIIPGLNSSEIPDILQSAGEAGAQWAGMTMVRLNGAIGEIFTDWLKRELPDRADKVLSLIKQVHGGNLNDSRWGERMRGDGPVANAIHQLFKSSRERFIPMKEHPIDLTAFRVPPLPGSQLGLF
jgi:DNA repair photolyase